MSTTRKIKRLSASRPTLEGAGVHLRRAFGFGDPHLFDPFLLLDDFRGDDPADYAPGFPWHPHRGIETITYVLAGEVDHGDSLGNSGVIGAGDIQWMTAGSGIIHQEMPRGDDQGRMYGFQLWANLPASQKMMDPRYREVKSAEIPVATLEGGVTVRVISGESGRRERAGSRILSLTPLTWIFPSLPGLNMPFRCAQTTPRSPTSSKAAA